ncbi:MAG: class I SAM-dependent methyltransferase [Bryobacteraceae bacterium]|nr:class I SAM-dependent methyltransferase [Bryobacteraceae bacterium]
MKNYFQGAGWEEAADDGGEYFRFHRRRFEYLLSTLDRLIAGRGPVRVLDIGLSPLTRAIAAHWPEAAVDSLGFPDVRYRLDGGQHYEWDLNEAQRPELWPAIGPWDVIVFAEVLEHIHAAPSLVLACLASWLRTGGYLLLQTPNAASLTKRVMLLLGRQPYEMIRESSLNPGHFREYTVAELKSLATDAGLEAVHVSVQNYFRDAGWGAKAARTISRCLPPTFRDGITMVLQKPARSSSPGPSAL